MQLEGSTDTDLAEMKKIQIQKKEKIQKMQLGDGEESADTDSAEMKNSLHLCIPQYPKPKL